ncbi:hypothetical protein GCM10028778_07930 [Barrientosiimonas marina]
MKKVNLERIRSLRNEHNLSQREMAQILSLNSLYPYHRKEVGSQNFTADELHTIAEYFEVPVEYFFNGYVAKKCK